MNTKWPKRHQPLWGDSKEELYVKEKAEAEKKMEASVSDCLALPTYSYYISSIFEEDKKKKPRKRRSKPSGCKHQFQDYIGFTHSYRFCTKCDRKQEF